MCVNVCLTTILLLAIVHTHSPFIVVVVIVVVVIVVNVAVYRVTTLNLKVCMHIAELLCKGISYFFCAERAF